MNNNRIARALLFLLTALAGLCLAPVDLGATEEEDDEPEEMTMDEARADSTVFPGLFTIFRHDPTGQLRLLVRRGQLGRELIYCTFTTNAVVDARRVRGEFYDNRIIVLQRYHDRVEFVAPNLSYYFDPASPLHRASSANRPPAILATAPIIAEDKETGDIIIDADVLFLEESLTQIQPSLDPDIDDTDPKLFQLGELSVERTRVAALRSYPRNTDIVVDYVFNNPVPRVFGGPDVTDARYVTIQVQHSLIEAPTNNYKPRLADSRVGYFTNEQTDLTSTVPAPFRDLVQRWHLEKKQPGAALSEPVEPITFWIENTTPLELRDFVREGALAWNGAFEGAGFKDAVVVKVQPDDADWDAGDIRYNVIRWSSSPRPAFGGLGPSFVDPRTGQILGADIMLEFVYATFRILEDELFAPPPARETRHSHACRLAAHRQADLIAGRAVARALGLGEAAEKQLLHEAIVELVMHEVGHTLGLQHNMRGSQLHPPERIHDANTTRQVGLSGSVMDYNTINLAPPGVAQGQFFATQPGPYDVWAIQFGYAEALADPAAEQARLTAVLDRSTEPALAFGNDADDMRDPGSGLDPRVMVEDLSADPLAYSAGRFALLRKTASDLTARMPAAGESYEVVVAAFRALMREITESAETVSRFIGGVYVDHARKGQPGAGLPLAAVPAEQQRAALTILRREVFAPDALAFPAELLARLQRQRRGFHSFSRYEEPRVGDLVLGIQARTLDHLLHPRVLARLSDSRSYGGTQAVADYGADLSAAIFDDDAQDDINPTRQNLQTEYVHRLAAVLEPTEDLEYDGVARAMAFQQLQEIRDRLAQHPAGNRETRAHVAFLAAQVDQALDPRGDRSRE